MEKLQDIDVDYLFKRLKGAIDLQFKTAYDLDLNALRHRATLWIPGFTGWELVQATGYIGNPVPDNRSVTGRRFSVRYGIIGRAWRLRATQYNWDVNNESRALVRHWGLTLQEARKQGDQHVSLMAFVIPSNETDGDPLGVVYLEADGTNALMPSQGVDDLVKRQAGDSAGRRFADIQADSEIWQPVLHGDHAKHLIGALINLRRAFNWDLKVIAADGR
jgi:hypothetical protein